MRIDERLEPEDRALLARVGEIADESGVAAYLVGGPVRDLLLGRPAPDLDVAIEGPVQDTTEALAERLDARVRKTTEFMTSTLLLEDGLELDIARARTETYPKPGALPVVSPATLAEDLGRRDFSVNAMAISLDPRQFGELIDPHCGREDLELRVLRVLHGSSFSDDPTRMLRAVRFLLRLDFGLEAGTAELLDRAVAERRASAVSGARLRNELECIFAEAPARALPSLRELRLFEGMGFAPVSERACEAAEMLPRAARGFDTALSDVDTLAACLAIYAGLSDQGPRELAERTRLDASARDVVIEGAQMIVAPPDVLTGAAKSSELFFALRGLKRETGLAVWTALDDVARERLERYWLELRGTVADIDGADLIAEGHAPGPGFTEALEAALAAKLDNGADRARQLRVADDRLGDPL